MQDFRNLKVWQRAQALTLAVYRTTRNFPADERFGLTTQLRRSCASIPANNAEGCARARDVDFARFVNHAAGSASESDHHLRLGRELKHLDDSTYAPLFERVTELKRMLSSFERTLRGAT